MADKTFTITYDGLVLKVEATDNGDGTIGIKVLCVEGYANINAFYWSDGDDTAGEGSLTGFNAKKDSSLNMNGTDVDWDGGVKLSDAGLGKSPPETYLSEGGSYSFTINASLDDLDTIGIRATSTSSPEGSIKGVAEEDVPPADHFPDFDELGGADISHVVLVFDTDSGDENGDGFYTVKIDGWSGSNDLDNDLDAILAYLVANDPNVYADTELLGAQIKGGSVGKSDGSYDDYWATDGSPDTDIVIHTKTAGPNTFDIEEIISPDAIPSGLDVDQGSQTNVDKTYTWGDDIFVV